MAQGVAEIMAAKLNKSMMFDSAGTGDWHAGESPDPRAVEAAARRGYDIAGQRARALSDEDFARFDHIIGMDAGHKRWLVTARDVRRLEERPVSMLMDWSVGLAGKDVPDPYYGDGAAFEHALDLIEKGVDGLLRRI
ncbi:protein tyrosine phosphatase [Glycocaulis alkaliphilus]|uniref:protein-tyrosine-phosphatase n=2 Tax=Glycocaulis alkaliphilus TaxID=1434191 RepID=A0A3T0E5C3_9PROT|nr:protein tyrosine phosphatase [Glycocaulis alkaliphilus]